MGHSLVCQDVKIITFESHDCGMFSKKKVIGRRRRSRSVLVYLFFFFCFVLFLVGLG